MIRVLFLTESFHPVLGGGETHVRRLGARLVARGHRVTVITRRGEAGWPAEDEVDGIRVRRVRPAGPARIGKYLMVPAALRALAHEGPRHDLVVIRSTRVLGVPGLLAARALDRPVILQPETNGELRGEARDKLLRWETFGTAFDPPIPATIKPLILITLLFLALQAISNLIHDWNKGPEIHSVTDDLDMPDEVLSGNPPKPDQK